jgi:hypothetical protein
MKQLAVLQARPAPVAEPAPKRRAPARKKS